MAAKVITKCVQRSDFQFSNGEWSFVWAALLGMLKGALVGFGVFMGGSIAVSWALGNAVADGLITAATATAIAGGFAVGVIAAGALYGAVAAVCDRLMNGKLICLGGDRCAIGRVMHAETSGLVDNDFGVNLLLAPHHDGVTDADLENDGLQGFLVAPQPATAGLGFTRYPDRTPGGSEILHCEFEGEGVHDQCIAWEVGAVAIGIAIGVCVAFPPACIPALIIAAAIALIAWLISLFTGDEGSPRDAAVNEESGDIKPADENGGHGDCVVITGRWVYDGGHSGWNELHPVLTVQKLPDDQCPADDDTAAFRPVLTRWCSMTMEASGPLTKAEQDEPKNRWAIAPQVG
jgi:hypothetical protein